ELDLKKETSIEYQKLTEMDEDRRTELNLKEEIVKDDALEESN
ncbi:43904_t:CDS:1, partial [Gigaspora margarita]